MRIGGVTPGQIVTILVAAALAALLPPAISAALFGGVALGSVLLVRPTLAVYLLVFAVPYESLRQIQLGGLNATITEFIAFCGGLAFLMQALVQGKVRARWDWWRTPLLIFALVMLVSMSQATDIKLSIKELLKLGEMLLTYLLVLAYIDTPAKVRRLIILIAIAALSQGLLGMLQAGAHFGPASFARGALLRGSGTFDQPNPFAGYLNLTLPLLFAAVVNGVPLVGRWTRPILLVLGMAILLSVSRGALLASVAATGVILAVAVPRSRPVVFLAATAFVGTIAATLAGVPIPGIGDKVAVAFGLNNVDVANPTPLTWPVAERLAHMIAGLNMFFAHPLLGVGVGNYAAAYPQFQAPGPWDPPLGHAHNYYINAAAEGGVLGLAAFLLVLISGFVIATRLYRLAQDRTARTIALGTLGVLVTVAVHSFFDDIFVHAMEAQLALVVGLATVSCRLSAANAQDAVSRVQHRLAPLTMQKEAQ